MEKTYKCTTCKEYKALGEFYKNASTSTKRATKCKICMRTDNIERDRLSRVKREEAKKAKQERFIYYGNE